MAPTHFNNPKYFVLMVPLLHLMAFLFHVKMFLTFFIKITNYLPKFKFVKIQLYHENRQLFKNQNYFALLFQIIFVNDLEINSLHFKIFCEKFNNFLFHNYILPLIQDHQKIK